jgi:dTDP-4-amino-4,6-dideoxygalactose transaminase
VHDLTLAALGYPPVGPHGEITPKATAQDLHAVNSALLAMYGPDENKVISDLERAVEEYHHDEVIAIAAANGTEALYMALIAAGIGPEHEVIVPALSFVASSHAVHWTGARPVFADIDPYTFTVDPERVAERVTDDTGAVLAVATHGLSADLDPLLDLCGHIGARLVEDAAQAFGATYRDRRVGTFGISAGVSNNKAKPWAAKDGGIVLVRRDAPDAAYAGRLVGTFGEERAALGPGERRSYWSRYFGVNLRHHPLAAAWALSTLGLDGGLHAARLAAIHRNASILNHVDRVLGLRAPVVPEDCTSTYAYYRVVFDPEEFGFSGSQAVHMRDAVVQELERLGVPVDTWQFDPLPAMPPNRTVQRPRPFRPGVPMQEMKPFDRAEYPNTVRVLESSFVLGTPDIPLWAQPAATVEAWVEVVTDVFRRIDRLMAEPHVPLRIAPPIPDSDR